MLASIIKNFLHFLIIIHFCIWLYFLLNTAYILRLNSFSFHFYSLKIIHQYIIFLNELILSFIYWIVKREKILIIKVFLTFSLLIKLVRRAHQINWSAINCLSLRMIICSIVHHTLFWSQHYAPSMHIFINIFHFIIFIIFQTVTLLLEKLLICLGKLLLNIYGITSSIERILCRINITVKILKVLYIYDLILNYFNVLRDLLSIY